MNRQYSGELHKSLVDECAEFLEGYYREDVAVASRDGENAVTVDLQDIWRYDTDIAKDAVDYPLETIAHLQRALQKLDLRDAELEDRAAELDVRIEGVEWEIPVSQLRVEHEGKLLGVRGQVSEATQVQPRTTEAYFRCERCSSRNHDVVSEPIPQYGDELVLPEECDSCERNGPWTLHEKSVKRDHQIVTLLDEPGESQGGSQDKVPVHLYDDLAGSVQAGDSIRVNAYVDTEQKRGTRGKKLTTRQPWVIEASSIDEKELAFEDVEPERVEEIKELSAADDLFQQFVDSFAPDILTDERGDKHKLAIILQLFSGVERDNRRGDINILFIGEPGTGKSHYLGRAREIAPKAVEASGKGATAAGLTATATQSDYDDGWMLDAGALVMASGGLACIDEFDKMTDSARKSMHEALENQRVPINKAGINTTLTTKTAVLAAANPKGGTFDRFTPLTQQIDLGPPLLSRFDLRFGLTDPQDKAMDEEIARHQYRDGTVGPLEDSLMREYVAYARQNVEPSIEDGSEVEDTLVDYYVELRKQAAEADDAQPPTPRVNDSLRRLAEASARMRLSDTVEMQDADRAVSLMRLTIGDTALDEDGTLNFSHEGGTIQSKGVEQALLDAADGATVGEIAERVGMQEAKVQAEIEKLSQAGKVYEPQQGHWRAT